MEAPNRNELVSISNTGVFWSPRSFWVLVWRGVALKIFFSMFGIWIIVSSRALASSSWRLFLVTNHFNALVTFKTILGKLTTAVFGKLSFTAGNLFNLVPWIFHKLHNFFKLLLTFWSRRINFYDLRLTILSTLCWLSLRISMHRLTIMSTLCWSSLRISMHRLTLLSRIHHFLHHLFHGISMVTFLSGWAGLWVWWFSVSRSVSMKLFRILLMRSINISFLAFSIFTFDLFAMTIMAFNFVARFFLEGMHLSIFSHLALAWALEGLFLNLSVRWVHSWHFSDMLESIGHLVLLISHTGLHLMHRIFNRVLDRASHVWKSEAWATERWAVR